MWIRQSTASQEILLGPFLDSTDGNTAETGLTIANTDIKLWKEGATTEANKNSGGATHIAGGRYYAVLDATDTNTLGKLEVNVHVSGALAVRREFMVVPAMVYDSLILGTDRLDTNVTHVADTAQTANDNGADINAILVDTNSLNDTKIPQTLNLTASGNIGIDWANVENPTTVLDLSGTDINLVDTTTTNTDMRGTDNAALATDLATAQADLDTLTGADGVTLATSQGNYAPAKAGDAMGLTAGGVDAVLDEALSGHTTAGTLGKAVADIETDATAILTDTADMQPKLGTPSTDISADIAAVQTTADAVETDTQDLQTQIGTAGAGLTDLGGMSTGMKAEINAEADAALAEAAAVGIKKNSAFSNLEFLMVDATDHVTPETGLTVTGEMSIDGAAFVAVNGAIAEVSNGIYQADLTAADTNGDVITYRFSSAGAADTFVTIKTRA